MLRREALEQRMPRAIKEAAARGDEEAVVAWVGTDDDVRLKAVHGTWSDRTRVTRSLLMIAAEKGHFMLTEALLRRGAKPNWQSCDGHSALTLAVTGTCERREQGRSKVVRALTPCPRTRLLLSRARRSVLAATMSRRAWLKQRLF